MQITSSRISDWAATREAQASLPRLIRRLVYTAGTPTQIDFPAGDSISLPGWDGEVTSEHGSPWVPKGKSYWECSCEAQITKKANEDYTKRTRGTNEEIRSTSTLVILSARKWSRKKKWLKEKQAANEWAEVRAYDANDLEQWLEQSSAVAVQFAEELGLTGQGVESGTKYWEGWSQQSAPLISAGAFFIDRENTRERFIADLRHRLENGQIGYYPIKADSVSEATAFVCAALIAHPDLAVASLVVTESRGWQFVQQNPALKVAVAARPEIAENPANRNGLVVIIPYAAGDMAGHYRGIAGRDDHADLVLERPRIHEFEKALISIGLDQADAKRAALSTGRSWSVFRRRYAKNPAIRRPVWLDTPQACALSTICLLGAWSSDKEADREAVARLSGRTYEDVERDLGSLALLDDAPIVRIGDVWKAKSSLELLDLFGDRITRSELDRFFEIAREILFAPDPELELPDEDRYAAQIYGKTRPHSGLLIQAICDTLVRLAVRGPQVPALSAANIEGRIARFVHELLHDADGTRWLSLSSLLPPLAEAAPDAFLNTVEASLAMPDAPVKRLLTETRCSSLMGRCWHAGLLWAIETLAWAPARLTRVSLVLARLTRIEIKGNWGNTPQTSLINIFRSWIPQTAADIDQRIAVLDTLIARESDAAFDLLDDLVHIGHDFATPSARPSWRDDDAGAGYGVTNGERHKMLAAAADRLIACSEGHPQRIARLIEKSTIFDDVRVNATLAITERFAKSSSSDEEREVIRAALRKKIHWHRNCDRTRNEALDNKLRGFENLYDSISPIDPVVRYRWLFAYGWQDLPARVPNDYKKHEELIESLRINALQEINAERGMTGIEQISSSCPNAPDIGVVLVKLGLKTPDLAEWIVDRGGDLSSHEPLFMTICALLRALPAPRSKDLINIVLEKGKERGWDAGQIARFLVLAREERATWEIVTSCGPEVEKAYWSITSPGYWLRRDEADIETALHRLLDAGRPRTALQACLPLLKKVDARLIAEMLELIIHGEEPEGPLMEFWHIRDAVEKLEASGAIERDRLVRLEFGLIPALGFEGEQCAKSLYHAIMSEPRLFTELIYILYKPESGEREEEPLPEEMKTAARIVWRVLQNCRRQPGTRQDGTIDCDEFIKFIDETRELCRKIDRLRICDETLGQILAYAPADTDGTWPFGPARDVLDRPDLQDMRYGFQIGVSNKRGVTCRSYDEGGSQERNLAETYHSHARALYTSHPNVAAVLEEIAHRYECDGLREDLRSKLSIEGY